MEYLFDYSKLRGRIKERMGTQENFATALGMSSVALSNKLLHKSEFTQEEITRSCEVLDIPLQEVPAYFFCKES